MIKETECGINGFMMVDAWEEESVGRSVGHGERVETDYIERKIRGSRAEGKGESGRW